jgi:hypothetical protein
MPITTQKPYHQWWQKMDITILHESEAHALSLC